MAQGLVIGKKALVVGKHPHTGCVATLLSYGPYGLAFLRLEGWHCRRETGEEFYAKSVNLRPL